MSGPYLNGLGKRKRSESTSSTSDSSDFFSGDRQKTMLYKKRHVAPSDAEVIPKFQPENNNSNIIGWLHKIDQLGDVYGWNDTDRTFIMQLRLRGSAREWYDDLENYDLTWNGWKETLKIAFPRSTDYVDRLERMLARTKEDKETMTKYYHEKLSLLKKCNVYGEDAISCIIRGLPHELRTNAKAYSCETPEQLYHGYLSSLENFKLVETYTVRNSTWRRGARSIMPSSTSTHQLQPKKCYTCRREGHEARDCVLQRYCEICRRSNHTTAACWFGAGTSRQQSQKVSQVLHITYDIYADNYKRTVLVNGQQLRAFIDTGSKMNILCISQAKNLKVQIKPSIVVMRGFGGSCVNSLGSCHLSVLIDNVILEGIVELTDYITADIDLLIGQTMINSDNISLVTSPSSIRFVPSKAVQNIFADFNLNASDFIVKYTVHLKHAVRVPKQSQLYVEVYIDCDDNIAKRHTFLTHTVWMQLGNLIYFIPSAVINSHHSYLKVVNLGCTDVGWEPNTLIARAELITIPVSNSESKILAIDNFETDHIRINITDIDKGQLSDVENKQLLSLLNKYASSFARSTKDLGCTDLIKMHIRTINDQPVCCKPYRLSHKESEIVNGKVKDLLDAGIIRESMSDYASPVVLVRKKGGDYRLCRI
ncbi:jg229 [Pararge aegeria aegeria]|uniref:Jg229 protein n=1 Tax=Pararge aegeria aegeria TaxID=348720 RepID=A0A8S4SJU0_9NEOP|nr:jg229 [Pararge aegeria aegeria]